MRGLHRATAPTSATRLTPFPRGRQAGL